jgi:hypothetical protein
MGGECGGVAHHLFSRHFAVACFACARVVLCLFLTGSGTNAVRAHPAIGSVVRPLQPAHAPLFTTSRGERARPSLSLSSVLSCCFGSLFVGRSLAVLPVVDCSRRPV